MIKNALFTFFIFALNANYSIAKVSQENFKVELGPKTEGANIFIQGKVGGQLIAQGIGHYDEMF